ncbi:MAG: winged helix-turn-helix transcriptional regulator [Alphaproteobacteria bacterium]|nr:winged helix-turn-helix transcriptional regulator [Alphaproteobacteria bacterium]
MTKAKSKSGADKAALKLSREALHASPTHLLHRALQLALDFHAEAAGDSAVTQRQFTVLAAAAGSDGSTQNDLVRATGIDRSTLADLVARLLAKGLLQREKSATDGRANTVRLSPAGRAALDGAADAAAAGDRRLLGLLSPKKRETFLKLLSQLALVADVPAGARKAKTAKTKTGKGKSAKPKPAKSEAKAAKKKTKTKAAKAHPATPDAASA